MENSSKHKTGAAGKRKRTRNIHIIIEVLIFIALVAVTAFLLQPLRMSILRQMAETRDYLIGEAEAFLGRKIEYGSMGPSIFAVLDIRDIRILNDDGEAVLTIGRFRLSYSLLALIMGEKQNSLRSIRIDMPVINMDTERDADLISLLFPSSQDVPQNDSVRAWQGLDFLPDEIRVRMRGGSGIFTFGANTVSVQGLSIDSSIQNRRLIFTSRWEAETALSGLFGQNIQTRMSGDISGDFAADFSNGNLNLSVPVLSGDLFTFKSITVNLSVTPEVIELRKIKDRSPYDLFVRYEIDTNTLNAELFADNFSPGDILSFNGNWRSYNEWLNTHISGSASFLRSSDENIQYEIDLSGITPPQFTAEDASFEIKGKGDAVRADFFPLHLSLPLGEIFFEGDVQFAPAAVNGNLSINDISLTRENALNADFVINTFDNEISIFSESIIIGSLTLSAFDAYLINENNELSFTVSAFRFRDIESYDNVSLSRVNLDGSYEFNPRHLQVTFLLDSFSVEDMIEAASPFVHTSAIPDMVKDQTGNMLVTTEVFVTTDFEYISYNAPRFVAAYSGNRDVLALFSLSGTDRRFELSNGSILAEKTLDFSGDADFSDINDISFSFQAVYDDFSYFVDGLFLDQRSLNINGSYGFSAYMTLADDGNYSGSIFADSVPIPLENGTARFSLSTFVRWADVQFWSVDVERLEFVDIPLPGGAAGHVSIQGIADNDGAIFPRIYFDDGKGSLTGTARADWENTFSSAALSVLLSDQAGLERYSIQAAYANQIFDASVSGFGMRLSRFVEHTSNIIASVDADFHWSSVQSFSLGIDISSLTGMIGTYPINAYAHIDADQDKAIVQNIRVLFGDFEIDIPSIEMNLIRSDLNGSMNISGTAVEKNIDIGLRANVNYKPIDSWLQIPEAVNSFQGSLDVYKFHIDTKAVTEPFQFTVSNDETLLTVNGGPKEMIRFSMSPEGDFYMGFSNPAPLRGSVIGNISQGQIDAHTSNLYVDMVPLFAMVPDYITETINVSGGFVDVSVQVKGSLLEPEFFGTAKGTSIRIQLPQYLAADIGPTPIIAKLEGTEMTFGPVITRVGDGLAPDTFTLNILVEEASPIPYALDLGGIKAAGDASGKLIINLEGTVIDVQGDVTGYNTIVTMGDAESGSTASADPDRTATDAVVDINITAGSRVEFLYPNESFPIVSAYASLGSSIHVMADSASGSVSVKGDVGIRGGEIYYINRSFYIREGTLHLNETEQQFNPLISARADINEISQEGPVTISLILDNAPVMSFTPRFESNPPLSQLEIMSILGQASSEGLANPFFVIATGTDLLSRIAGLQSLQRNVRDFFRLDMFSVRTPVLQNILFLVTGIQQPDNGLREIGNFLDNTSVYIGKYITKDVFFQGIGSIRYDETAEETGGIRFGLDLGLEFNSPFANMKLNLVPQHLENMFIDDLSFTLSWKWTF